MDKRYKKPELQMPTHDGRLFTWTGASLGTTDMTQFIGKQMFSPVYRDACDVGCYIWSHKTGVYKPFILLYTQRGEDGVQWWEFESMDDGGRFTVRIYND